jgi:sigma-B regulation protein RsbU (phosphoserine phosphatase)
MDTSILSLLLVLLEKMCVVVVFAYLLIRTDFFQEILEKKFTIKNQLVLIAAFGLLAIYGTYAGIPYNGAVANIRDIGPVMAGLIGGPVVGLGAGLIGGIHRYTVGGFTAVSCSLSTVLAGLFAGFIYLANKKKFIGIPGAIAMSLAMVSLDLGLALVMDKPYSQALQVVGQISFPMLAANAIGTAIFAFIVVNMIREKKVAGERDNYRDELERKRTELNIARDIQMSFLPDSVPELKGYDIAAMSIPANEVGGDFYDFIKISENKLGLTIADVSGKSVPAALFMALSREVVRSSAIWGADAVSVIKTANTLITEDSRSGMFVTLFYAVLEEKERSLTYVNAGHNPPVLLNGRTGEIRMLRSKGIALGAMEGTEFEEVALSLESGTTIVFYTDGVTEANNKAGDLFGEERLYDIIKRNSTLTAKGMIETIRSEVETYCMGAQQADDITLMVLKVE